MRSLLTALILIGALAAPARADPVSLNLKSPAFRPAGPIPKGFSCQGDNRSPPLAFGQYPAATKSLVLIVDDPDAPSGNWVHWVVFDMPPDLRALPEGITETAPAKKFGVQGRNSFGKTGWGGPCPPAGPAHHYHFKLYALDKKLGLEVGEIKSELEKAMDGHIVGKAELIGTYARE